MHCKKYLFIITFLLAFPFLFASAESITYSNCFEKSRTGNSITVHMKDMQGSIDLSGAYGQYFFTVENIDPDFSLISDYDQGSLTKNSRSVTFTKTVSGSANITILPWYEPSDSSLYFVDMGDSQIGTSDSNQARKDYISVLEQVEIVNPYFSVVSGDIISGDGDDETDHREMYDTYFTVLESNLSTPQFTVPGNHDWSNGLDIYEEYFGDSNFSFDYKNTHFSFISSVNDRSKGTWSSETLAWLEDDLQSNFQTNQFLFFHHSLYPPSWSDISYDSTSNRNTVAQTIDDNGVDIVINGHNHGYDYSWLDSSKISTISNGFYQLISGGAGGSLATAAQYHHFNLFQIQDQNWDHQVVAENDFPISKTESDYNDGTQESESILLNNESAENWPWIRLKYKLANTVDYIYVYDDQGNYYDYNTQNLGDYRVVYVESDIPADSSKVITTAASTKLHTGVTNTVYSSGQVSYSQMPSDVSTETNISASTSIETSNIIVTEWNVNENQYSWQEVAADSNLDTIYSINELETGYRYKVEVDNSLYGYFYPIATGEMIFTYSGKNKKRNFTLTQDKAWWPNKIAIMPNSSGGPQVRTFNGDGKNLAQFFAYSSKWNGGYNVLWADVDGDQDGEIITSTQAGLTPRVRVFNSNGKQLASKNVFQSVYKKGANIKAGDIDNDGKDEIIVSSGKGDHGNKIKIYNYNKKKSKLKLILSKRIYSSAFNGGVELEIANVNSGKKEEIIVAPASGQEKIKVLQYKNGKLKTLAQEDVYSGLSYDGVDVAVGDINKKGKAEILTVPKQGGNNLLKAYRLTNKNKFKLINEKKVFPESYTGGLSVISGDVTGNNKSEIIVAPLISEPYVKVYKFYKNNLKLLQKRKPYGESYQSGFNIALVDIDNNWDLELAVAPKSTESSVKIYNYQKKKIKLHQSFIGFLQSFTGGINILNNL